MVGVIKFLFLSLERGGRVMAHPMLVLALVLSIGSKNGHGTLGIVAETRAMFSCVVASAQS